MPAPIFLLIAVLWHALGCSMRSVAESQCLIQVCAMQKAKQRKQKDWVAYAPTEQGRQCSVASAFGIRMPEGRFLLHPCLSFAPQSFVPIV